MDDRTILDRVLGRRFLLIVAVLMGLTALAASVAPRDPSVRDRSEAGPTPSPPPAAAAPETAVPASDADVVRRLDAGRTGEPRRIEASVGDRVAIVVRSDELGSVALGEIEVEAVDPESPARFDLFADAPATYPITLVEADRQIGVLEITE